MPARSTGSGTVSFGLVSIPVRFYVAIHSEVLSFNLIHKTCGSRIKQQIFCPVDDRTVERSELVRGQEVAKDQYVTFTDEELKVLEAAASPSIDIQEFVPLAAVDPVYFETSQYLGPDKGGEKAYHLLADAMRETGVVAVAQHVSRGKERLVLIRPRETGLVLHALYYADEVRSFDEIDTGGEPKVRPNEIELARKLIDQLSVREFHPEQFADTYRERLQAVVDKKVAGEAITVAEAPPQRAQVIDLMDALKESLARGGGAKAAPTRPPAKRPAAARRATRRPQRRAQKR